MIDVRCGTNLDDYKTQRWPTEMMARPMVGDYVRAEGGKILRVVRITHATYKGRATDCVGGHEMHPIIEVALNR